MNYCEIKTTFETVFKGKNIMTPEVVQYGQAGPYIYELSEGTGFRQEPIFGVTMLMRNGERTDLSKMFHSQDEAREYIDSFKKKGRRSHE